MCGVALIRLLGGRDKKSKEGSHRSNTDKSCTTTGWSGQEDGQDQREGPTVAISHSAAAALRPVSTAITCVD